LCLGAGRKAEKNSRLRHFLDPHRLLELTFQKCCTWVAFRDENRVAFCGYPFREKMNQCIENVQGWIYKYISQSSLGSRSRNKKHTWWDWIEGEPTQVNRRVPCSPIRQSQAVPLPGHHRIMSTSVSVFVCRYYYYYYYHHFFYKSRFLVLITTEVVLRSDLAGCTSTVSVLFF